MIDFHETELFNFVKAFEHGDGIEIKNPPDIARHEQRFVQVQFAATVGVVDDDGEHNKRVERGGRRDIFSVKIFLLAQDFEQAEFAERTIDVVFRRVFGEIDFFAATDTDEKCNQSRPSTKAKQLRPRPPSQYTFATP